MRPRVLVVALLWAVAAVQAPPRPAAAGRWGDGTAIPVTEGHWEIGLFAPLRYGLRADIELSTHPLLMLVMPNLDAKVSWYRGEGFHFATRYALSYPTYLLELLSREGAGGLLPKNTEVPHTVMGSVSLLGTFDLGSEQLVTWTAGTTVAPSFTSDEEMPLLDFPFLYARFAALKAVATYELGLRYDGQHKWLAYGLDIEYYVLPVIHDGYTIEQGGWIGWLAGDHFTVRIGYRVTYGRYPAGYLFHYFPFLDLLIGG